jgi:hypothetical protein
MFGISEENALARTSPAPSQRSDQTESVITLDMVEADLQRRPILFAQASGAIE